MATGASLGALRAAAIKAGADTQFSATEAADAITAMGKAGVSTKDILSGGLTGALSLAAAGELDVGQAAEIAATAMNQFGLEGKDIPHIADLLAAGAGKAMGSVQDLAGALKFVGPVAKGLGISIEETTGSLAMFAQQGILGEQAGTSMRGMLLTLTSPSAIVAKKMEALGINVYDAAGKFIGMDGAAGELQRTLGPLDDATRNAALGQIFGNEQVTAARILYEGGAPAVDAWTKSVNDSGFAARQAAMLTDNLKGDIERLGGSLSSVLINAGSGANGMLRTMTQHLQGVVDGYGALPVPMQKSALGLAGVAAGGLLVTGALISVVPKIAETKKALDSVVIAGRSGTTALKGLGKAAGIAAVLAATAAAMAAISNATQTAVPGIEATTAALLANDAASGAAGGGVKSIDALFKGIGGGDTWSSPVDNLTQAWRRLTDKNTMESLNDNIDGVIGMTDAASKSAEVFANIGTALGQMVSSGNAAAASQQFDAMAAKLGLTDDETSKLMTLMPAYGEAIAGAANETKLAAGGTDVLAGAQTDLAAETQKAKDAIDAEVQALQDSGLVVLSTRAATRDFAQAQRDATAALKENGKSLADGTVKGDANRAALDKVASSALGLADSIYKQTGSEEAMRGSLIKSRASLVKTYLQFDNNIGRANAYADSIIKIPAHKTTQVELDSAVAKAKAKELQAQINAIVQGKVPGLSVDNAAGKAKIAALQAKIDALHGKNIAVNVNTHSYSTGPGGSGGPVANAAAGGYIRGPGTTTSDSIHTRLSDKEYVVKAKAVDYYGVGTMDAINSMRFAAGGYVGQRSTVSAAGPSLVGVAIEGTLDMGNGLIGVMRGVVKSEMAETGARARYAGVS